MFLKEQSQHLGEPPFNFTKLEYSRYCHDATWALAWSLHKAIESKSDVAIRLHTRVVYRYIRNAYNIAIRSTESEILIRMSIFQTLFIV